MSYLGLISKDDPEAWLRNFDPPRRGWFPGFAKQWAITDFLNLEFSQWNGQKRMVFIYIKQLHLDSFADCVKCFLTLAQREFFKTIMGKM